MGAEMNYYFKVQMISTVLLSVLFIQSAYASITTFEKEYTYQASEIDSKVTSRANALEQVKRLLLEELGTYLESKTEVKNFMLTQDQITTLTGGIVSAVVVSEKWDGVNYVLKAKISADPNEVAKAVNQLRNDTSKTKELENTKELANKYAKEIIRLKKQLNNLPSEKLAVKNTEYKHTVDLLSATNAYNEAIVLVNSRKPKEEIIAKLNQAIKLNPNYDAAYATRGIQKEIDKPHEAIEDYKKALESKPGWSLVHNGLGRAYRNLGEYDIAIESFNKAINNIDNYYVDFKKGMLSGIYFNRGLTYEKLGDLEKATDDMKKSAGGPAKSWLKKHDID